MKQITRLFASTTLSLSCLLYGSAPLAKRVRTDSLTKASTSFFELDSPQLLVLQSSLLSKDLKSSYDRLTQTNTMSALISFGKALNQTIESYFLYGASNRPRDCLRFGKLSSQGIDYHRIFNDTREEWDHDKDLPLYESEAWLLCDGVETKVGNCGERTQLLCLIISWLDSINDHLVITIMTPEQIFLDHAILKLSIKTKSTPTVYIDSWINSVYTNKHFQKEQQHLLTTMQDSWGFELEQKKKIKQMSDDLKQVICDLEFDIKQTRDLVSSATKIAYEHSFSLEDTSEKTNYLKAFFCVFTFRDGSHTENLERICPGITDFFFDDSL